MMDNSNEDILIYGAGNNDVTFTSLWQHAKTLYDGDSNRHSIKSDDVSSKDQPHNAVLKNIS